MPSSFDSFLAAFPEYSETAALDLLRHSDYARLDRLGHIYLDYTGAGLYADSQIRAHYDLLASSVLANPHSHNPTSSAATERVAACRASILDYFHADPSEYTAIFTANASAALKLVGESFAFDSDSHYLLTYDNHNSVNGIREFARARSSAITYIPLELPELRVDDSTLDSYFAQAKPNAANLFAYPAQSNFSGVQHPLSWIARAQAQNWTVLLDAAAFVPANPLDLSRYHPDFVSLSFYKMFGYPTGLGCLLARQDALRRLRRPWFAGGTITVASVQGDRYFMHEGSEGFEDGTLDFLGIPAIHIGLDHLRRTGIPTIKTRSRALIGYLIQELPRLTHSNGAPVVRLYGPESTERRGGTLTMNFYDPQGAVIDHRLIEESAALARISLRTGCFCNPGDGEIALRLTRNEIVGCFNQPHVAESSRFTVDDFRLCVDGKSTGAVRVSVGIASNFADVEAFLRFARGFAS